MNKQENTSLENIFDPSCFELPTNKPYSLTLTLSERKAIDWVGHRYYTGDDFFKVLIRSIGENEAWEMDKDITFHLSESQAWEVKDLFEQEELLFPCFSRDLTEKLLNFYNSII